MRPLHYQQILAHALQGETPKIVHATGGKWTFETIDLEFGELRVRLLKEFGGVEILFGASPDALEWFNAPEVFRSLSYEVAPWDLAGTSEQLLRLCRFLEAHLLTGNEKAHGAAAFSVVAKALDANPANAAAMDSSGLLPPHHTKIRRQIDL